MKHIIYCLIVLCLGFVVKAQDSNSASFTVIIGEELEQNVRVFNRQDDINLSLKPGDEHTFYFNLEAENEIEYFIKGLSIKVRLAKNDNVVFSLLESDGEKISVSGGKYESLNNYYLFKARHLNTSWSKEQSLTDSLRFKSQMDLLKKESSRQLNNLLKASLVDKKWCEQQEKEIKYWIYNRMISYPFMNAAYSYKKIPDVIPSFTRKVMSKEVLNSQEMVTYGSNLLGNILYNYGKLNATKYNHLPNPSAIGNLEMIKELVTNPEVKSMASQILLSIQLREYSDAGIQPVMDYFSKNCLDDKVKIEMLAEVEEISVLGPGKPAPDIELIDMEGNIHHLSDYKGKKVYIDVWATYCGKCLAEMPNVHELEKDYKADNWIFLMVSLDTNHAKWQKKAKELGHLDRQFIVKGGHKSQFNTDYRISFAPRYIIINSKGELVNFNAPYPSDGGTRQILDQVK